MKKEMTEKSKLIRLIIFWAVCLIAGIGVGLLIVKVTRTEGWDPKATMAAAAPALSVTLCALYTLANLAALIGSWMLLARLERRAAELGPDDEEALDELEDRLGVPMVVNSVLQVANMAVFPVLLWLVLQDSVSKALGDVIMAVNVLVFLGSMFASFAINKKSVDAEKALNPEKRGSLLDFSFRKTWMESCDEAQKQLIHEAGYQAFQTGSNACLVIWVVSMLLMFLLDTGVLPLLMVCAVWMALQIAYFRAVAKLSRRH